MIFTTNFCNTCVTALYRATFWIHFTTSNRNNTLMVTFPFVTFLILNPTVGIMSSLKCPDWKQSQKWMTSFKPASCLTGNISIIGDKFTQVSVSLYGISISFFFGKKDNIKKPEMISKGIHKNNNPCILVKIPKQPPSSIFQACKLDTLYTAYDLL